MANMQSPGIEVKEYDLTTYVPGVATTEAGIGGVFSWGPVEDLQLVSSESELVQQFGKPTNDNYETFLIAANFLAYSDALYVGRAADANAFNAYANTGAVANLQIKNDEHFETITASSNVTYYARFPGTLGNSLKVSVCDSANAYSSTFGASGNTEVSIAFTRNTFVATLTVEDVEDANSTVANTAANTIISSIAVGDWIKASNTSLGTQYLKVASVGSLSSANGAATANITFSNRFTLSDNIEMTSVQRYWEFFNLIDRAPATSAYAEARGGAGDELHVVVVDQNGLFTGTPNTVLETWNNLSRARDALAEQGGTIYYKNVINDSSNYIRAITDRSGAVSVNLASAVTAVDTLPYTASLSGGTNGLTETTQTLSALARVYDLFINPEEIDVSILIAGVAKGGTYGEGLANYIIDNIASVRKDLFVTISPALADVVNNPFQEAEAILEFRSALRKSSYAMISSAYKWQYDRYNDKWRWVAGCGDDAGLIARTDDDRDPWWSPAGENRGIYKNLTRLSYNPNQADRDLLYKNDINPVITKRGAGTVLWGDKTLHGAPSAFDRINVRRLFITIEKAIKKAAAAYLFEFNDAFTRARFRNMVEPYLRDVAGRRGITDFKVVCDETNNTGQVIDTNRFIADIYVKPARSINFITLNFIAVGTDTNFDYVIGKF